MLTTSGFTRTAKQIGIHSTTAPAFCRANTRASLQSQFFIFWILSQKACKPQSLIFLHNETLENIITHASRIKEIFL
jgi:hypothetical protein